MSFELGGKGKDEVGCEKDIHGSFMKSADGMEYGFLFEQGGRCKAEVDFDKYSHASFERGADGMELGLKFEHDGVDLLFEHGGKITNDMGFEKGLHVGTKGRRRRGRPPRSSALSKPIAEEGKNGSVWRCRPPESTFSHWTRWSDMVEEDPDEVEIEIAR